jgi:hypothetical protein
VNDALDEITEYMVQRALDYKREDFSSEILEDAVYSYLCLHFFSLVVFYTVVLFLAKALL